MDKMIIHTCEQALKAAGPDAARQIKAQLGATSSSLKKAISAQMVALRTVAASDLNRNNQTLRAKFEIPLISSQGEKTQVFYDEAKRIDTSSFLIRQADLQETELKSLLAKASSQMERKKIQSRLNEVQEKKQNYIKLSQGDAWRSSAESNIGVHEKLEMSTNPWIEKIYLPPQSSHPLTPFQVGRSGVFGFNASPKTNIQELIQKNAQKPSEKLQKEIDRRESMLRSQLGAMLSAQAETLAEGIQTSLTNGTPNLFYDTKTFPYTQMSLLHFTGNEPNLLTDMEWIFNQIEGKELIFDGKSGFDTAGNLHIPNPVYDAMNTPLKLKIQPSLYNFNVQGDTFATKKTKYKEVNEKAWSNTQKKYKTYTNWLSGLHQAGKLSNALYEEQLSSLNDLKTKIELQLNKQSSNYQIAADISELERMMNSSLGINCKSGKDRTSYLINVLINRHIGKHIEKNYPLYPEELGEIKKNLAAQVAHKGVGLHITGLNIGFKAFKITRFSVEGMRLNERLKLYLLAFKLR
ncbi:hypothetical protein [Parachlamydia acanthamoebae]|nr:hypothetical protein [Parachlamydia acanthamoebae]EFB41130.1 hypothetical protein pah_c050o100 [Parachlamydia acanthamoebae str. Hall's coccus]